MSAARPDRPARGSLFGLAFGDAVGKPVEFWSHERIRATPVDLRVVFDRTPALVTDDTQMALAVGRALLARPDHQPAGLAEALRTEFVAWSVSPDNTRAPGATCLDACAALARGGPWQRASVVGSKGCGATMRVPPVGLVPGIHLDVLAGVAQLQAALTHGHPTAVTAAELTAYAVRILLEGASLRDLPGLLRDRCEQQRAVYREDWLGDLWQVAGFGSPEAYIGLGWGECLRALDRLDAALPTWDGRCDPGEATGEGWIAEESLVTAVLCALRFADDPTSALVAAATTSGDSDSIACLAGALLGAAGGADVWPARWYEVIEYREELDAQAAARDGASL